MDDRVELRPWHESDAAAYAELVYENLGALAPVARWATSQFSERDFIAWLSDSPADLAWRLAIVRDSEPIGSLVAEGSVSTGVELSFWIAESARGQGIVPKCVVALQRALAATGVTTVEIHAQAANVASIEVAKKCGYTVAGEYSDRPSRPGVLHVVMQRDISDL